MQKTSKILFLAALILAAVNFTPAAAGAANVEAVNGSIAASNSAGSQEYNCVADEPSGKPVTVRARPNGKFVTYLKLGDTVYTDMIMTADSRGREWMKVYNYKKQYLGWAIGSHISCD